MDRTNRSHLSLCRARHPIVGVHRDAHCLSCNLIIVTSKLAHDCPRCHFPRPDESFQRRYVICHTCSQRQILRFEDGGIWQICHNCSYSLFGPENLRIWQWRTVEFQTSRWSGDWRQKVVWEDMREAWVAAVWEVYGKMSRKYDKRLVIERFETRLSNVAREGAEQKIRGEW